MCLANSAPVRPGLVERYRVEDAAPIVVDRERVEALGVELVERPLSSETSDFARHSTARLAAAIMELHEARSIRLAPEPGTEGTSYIIEE